MEQQYLELLKHIRDNGTDKTDRTGTGTRSIFGYQMRHALSRGFPLLTTKKVHTKSMIYELLWFLKGLTNIKYLKDNKINIWDEWADENGDLGPVYGKQWRSWDNIVLVPGHRGEKEEWVPEEYVNRPIDQVSDLINMIKKTPDSRRLIVSAWNVADLHKMKLMPCHCLFQFNTRPMTPLQREAALHRRIGLGQIDLQYLDLGEGHFDEAGVPKLFLDCQLYQRSADVFLGVPFNIASYALFTMMVAQVTGCEPGDFIHSFGDVHIYKNHFEQVNLQLSRSPLVLPTMKINPDVKGIFDFKFEDFELINYKPLPAIKADVAV